MMRNNYWRVVMDNISRGSLVRVDNVITSDLHITSPQGVYHTRDVRCIMAVYSDLEFEIWQARFAYDLLTYYYIGDM